MIHKQKKSKKNNAITEFVIRNVSKHPSNIVSLVVLEFGVTRATAHRYVKSLVEDGRLEATGVARGRTYRLRNFAERVFKIPLESNQSDGWTRETQEDVIWRTNVEPLLNDLPQNVTDLLRYGGTEMINNVLDHSGAKSFDVAVQRNAASVRISISDKGIGIFEKIKKECNLDDSRHALLELSKGKLTTDRRKHSGEGIFFSSRMFDTFYINSRGLAFLRTKDHDDDWLFEDRVTDDFFPGTQVIFVLSTNAKYTAKDVFAKFQDSEDAPGFAKTHVPVRLARYGNEQLVSRSQAKRVLARFERFSEVMLDFEGVSEIGQGFADEIFRVFALEHPDIAIIPIRTSIEVEKMIRHVKWGGKEDKSA